MRVCSSQAHAGRRELQPALVVAGTHDVIEDVDFHREGSRVYPAEFEYPSLPPPLTRR